MWKRGKFYRADEGNYSRTWSRGGHIRNFESQSLLDVVDFSEREVGVDVVYRRKREIVLIIGVWNRESDNSVLGRNKTKHK